jgi:hypothetical protein
MYMPMFAHAFGLDSITYHLSKKGAVVWRFPFGFQLVPIVIILFGLLRSRRSRWLASRDRNKEAIRDIDFFRRRSAEDLEVIEELAEIQATLAEERGAHTGLGLKEALFGTANFVR